MVVHPCRCCLRRASEKDLRTPYTQLGTTEIYLDMIRGCFDLHLTPGSNGECGICELCVGRLRDAYYFKMQVERSQEEFAQMKTDLHDQDDEPMNSKLDIGETIVEMSRESSADARMNIEPPAPDRGDEQTATTCSVRLQRLHGDEPRARHSRATPLCEPRRGSPMKNMDDNTTARAGLTFTCGICRTQFTDKPKIINHVKEHMIQTKIAKKCIQTFTKGCEKSVTQTSLKNTYRCDMCNETFEYKTILISHIKMHMAQKRYPCEVCNAFFPKSSLLKQHKKTHSSEKTYTCEISKSSFVADYDDDIHVLEINEEVEVGKTLNTHKTTTGKPYACDECDKTYTFKESFDKHKETHQKLHLCEECPEKFLNERSLFQHKTFSHTQVKRYNCEECDKKFHTKAILNRHKRVHITEKKYECGECNKLFKRNWELTQHKKNHSAVKPYTCEECKQKFNGKARLAQHMLSHSYNKAYNCGQCNVKFKFKGNLTRHKKNHTGQTPYACEECNKQFLYKGSLMKHMQTHTRNKPFSCKVCNKQFTYKKNFTVHCLRHKEETPFSCEDCNIKFKTSKALRNHKLRNSIHINKYTCDECNQTFKYKKRLESHIRGHRGGKPFACEQCSKTFGSIDLLRKHGDTHAVYKCEICDESYIGKLRYNTHFATHMAPKRLTHDV